MIIQKIEKDKIYENAGLLHEKRLYVPGWCAGKLFQNDKEFISEWLLELHIGYIDGAPIGWSLIYDNHYYTQRLELWVYVSNEHRRKGYATNLVNSIADDLDAYKKSRQFNTQKAFWNSLGNSQALTK